MAGYKHGFSPLTLTVNKGGVEAVNELVELGADVNEIDGNQFSPIARAAVYNNVEAIRALAELGDDVNTPDMYGHTPVCVFRCSGGGYVEAIQHVY